MSVLNIGTEYQDGDTVTSSNLNALITDATFSSASVDDTSTSVSGGSIVVKDGGINKVKLSTPLQGIIEKVDTAYLGADKTGNTRGSFSLDIQSSRPSNDRVASGYYSSALGSYNTASGTYSSAFGRSNTASGYYSSAFGYDNTASETVSSALGVSNTASGAYSSAFGYNDTASGAYSSAFGRGNTANGSYSSAFGVSNTASGTVSSAFGYYNTVSGTGSSAFGNYNTASGASSSAFGFNAKTTIDRTIEIGYWTDTTTRSSSVRMHPNGQIAMTIADSETAPTDGNATTGSEANETLARGMFTIQRNGNDLTLYVNDAGTIKSLSLGTLA
jgi:hypothetical protein